MDLPHRRATVPQLDDTSATRPIQPTPLNRTVTCDTAGQRTHVLIPHEISTAPQQRTVFGAMPKKPSRQQAAKNRAGEPSDLSARASQKAAAAAAAQPQLTFEGAIDAVEQMIEQSDLDAAEQALRSQYLIGNLRPGDINSVHAGLTPAMELLAQVLIGKQKTKEAFQWLTQCCKLQPDGGAEKWMYYGQLIGGREALEAFKRGIACMFKARASIVEKGQHETQKRVDPLSVPFTMSDPVVETPAQLSQQLQSLSKQISSGYTSMAELFVTDLCDEEGAEAECEKLLQLALQNCETNPDALYALANLRTIQQREPEACQVMEKLFEALRQCRAASIENMSVLALADDQSNENIPHTIHLADVRAGWGSRSGSEGILGEDDLLVHGEERSCCGLLRLGLDALEPSCDHRCILLRCAQRCLDNHDSPHAFLELSRDGTHAGFTGVGESDSAEGLIGDRENRGGSTEEQRTGVRNVTRSDRHTVRVHRLTLTSSVGVDLCGCSN